MMPSLRSDAPAPELTIYGQKYTGPRLHINGRDLPVITMDAETAFGKDYTLAKMSYTDYVRDPRMHVHCWSVKIGDNVWIGGSVTILGGVIIGEGAVIGAGSVVTRDIPAGIIAVGNPCRPLREITDADRVLHDIEP